MNIAIIEHIRHEIEHALSGRSFGKIFQLSRFEFAIDFRITESRYLFLSIEPANPRIYLITRRLRDLERQSGNPSSFNLYLRKRLTGARIVSITRIENERVLLMDFTTVDELGSDQQYTLAIQLTGRSANLFLLNADGLILETARETAGDGQLVGNIYAPPVRQNLERRTSSDVIAASTAEKTLSESLDEYYQEKAAEKRFQSIATAARGKLKQEIAKRQKLLKKLNGDLAAHGDADKWKRYGDLLLANVATARRDGGSIFVTDFYDENLAEIAIAADENDSITETAEKLFKKYTKARNAKVEIEKRLISTNKEIAKLEEKFERLETAISEYDENGIAELTGSAAKKPETRRGKPAETASGTRNYLSSDGFEILVGKKAKDNDFLTFRLAKSLDLWMHAADYPGSHVVVRNPNRKEIPPRTLIEAAQLAAFYSQGKSQTKAAVHYTQKKFVNKPKGAAPGMVSLASFKTILVEPEFPDLSEPPAVAGG